MNDHKNMTERKEKEGKTKSKIKNEMCAHDIVAVVVCLSFWSLSSGLFFNLPDDLKPQF